MASPIVPSAQDIGFAEGAARAAAAGRGVGALLLGVTRGIATMRWPAGSSLVAVEWSSSMIRRFWSRDGLPPGSSVVRADWRQLPLANASRDIAVGDGCYTALGTLQDVALLNAEVNRVLRPGGVFCVRCFARPLRGITPRTVFAELRAGHIGNVFLLQWLLAMAVHGDSRGGVALDDVWRAWREHAPQPADLLARCGWPEDSAWTLERWKGVTVRYGFPTVEELRTLATPHFGEIECHIPAYPWGECFPSLVMRAAPRK
jgi:SAM-dependent methyltransferase